MLKLNDKREFATPTPAPPPPNPSPSPIITPKPGKGWNMQRRMTRFAIILLLPAAIMITLFIGYPVVYSFFLTFSDFSVTEERWFEAGLTNYGAVFADRDFWNATWFTLAYTAVYVPVSVGLALFVGVLLQQVKIGTTFFRSLLFLPTVVPLTMGFLMFQWILDPQNGILNYFLRELGLDSAALNWLGDKNAVFWSMLMVTLWGFGPWILLLAGLLAIPKDFYDAAKVDGATPRQEFRHITLPHLRPALMVVTTLQVIKALKIFVPIYVLTSGGPAQASTSLYYLVFDKISQNKLAYATTVGWVFTIIVLGFAIGTNIILRPKKEA
jgi:multiple sugar transport system permease protein